MKRLYGRDFRKISVLQRDRLSSKIMLFLTCEEKLRHLLKERSFIQSALDKTVLHVVTFRVITTSKGMRLYQKKVIIVIIEGCWQCAMDRQR